MFGAVVVWSFYLELFGCLCKCLSVFRSCLINMSFFVWGGVRVCVCLQFNAYLKLCIFSTMHIFNYYYFKYFIIIIIVIII